MNRFGDKVVGLQPEDDDEDDGQLDLDAVRRSIAATLPDDLGVDWSRWSDGRA